MFEIWKQLSESGYTTKTFEEFKNEYSSEEGQKKLHEGLLSEGFTNKSFNDFSNEYFADSKPDVISADEIITKRDSAIMPPFKQPADQSSFASNTPSFKQKYKIPELEEVVSEASIEQAEQEQKKILQAPRQARADLITIMENVFDNNGWTNLNEDFKNLSKEEALQNPEVLEAVYEQAVQNYNALQPEIPLKKALGAFSPDNIKSQFAKNQEQKDFENQQEIIQEQSKRAYEIYGDNLPVWLGKNKRVNMEAMEPAQRILASELDVMANQRKIIDNPDSTPEQIAAAKIKIAELQPQVNERLRLIDEDYTFQIDPATGSRVSGDLGLSGSDEVIDATDEVKSQAEILAQLGKADQNNFEAAFIDFALDRQEFNETAGRTINYRPEGDLGNVLSKKLFKKGYTYETAPNGEKYFANVPLKEFIYYSKKLGDDSLIKEYIPSDQQVSGADVRMDIPSTLTQLRKDSFNLKIREQALNQAYLLNIDPSTMDKSFIGTMAGAAVKRTFGEAATTEFFPSTKSTREKLDEIQKLYVDTGIIQTAAQKENFKRNAVDIGAETTGYVLPDLPAFFLGGRIVGATMEIAGAGRNMLGILKAGKLRDKFGNIPMIGKTNIPFTPTAQKITYLGLRGLQEEATFQLATGGEAELGSGAAFAIGGGLLKRFIPFRFKGNAARYNPLLEKLMFGGGGFMTGSETVEISKATYNAITGEKDFQDSLEELYGEDSEFLERAFGNFIAGFAIGSTHLSKYDFKSVKQLEAIQRKYIIELAGIQKEIIKQEIANPNFENTDGGRELNRKSDKLRDKIGALQPVIVHANEAFLKSDLKSAAKRRDEAQQILSDPLASKDQIAKAKKDIKEANVLIESNRNHLEKTILELRESGVLGEFDFKIQEGKEGFTDAEKNNQAMVRYKADGKTELVIDLLDYQRGILAHEVTHLAMAKFFARNPRVAAKFRNALSELINNKLKGSNLAVGDQETLQELIEKIYSSPKEKSQQAEEFLANLVQLLQNPTYRRLLIEEGVFNGVRKSFMDFFKDNKLKPENAQLEGFNLKTAQDLLNFLGTFAKNIEGGKNLAQTIKDFKDIIIIGDEPIHVEGDPILSDKKATAAARSFELKSETEALKKDVFSKANQEYEAYKDVSIEAAGLMVGEAFRPLVAKKADAMYRDVPGYEAIRDLIIDEVSTGLGDVQTSKFANVADRKLKGQSIVSLVMSYDPAKEASLTSYIYGQLTNRIMGVVKEQFGNLGREGSFAEGQAEKLTESEGLGGGFGEGFVDLSSPELSQRLNDIQLKKALGLEESVFQSFDQTADRILNKPLPDVRAKEIIEYNLGASGKATVSFYDNNTASISINGKSELLKARTPKDVEIYLKKKGLNIESQDKLGNIRKQMLAEFRNDAYNLLQEQAGGTTDKGTRPSPEYSSFIERAWPLYKNFLSQSSINKRFADFKEPVIDKATGKQAREKTAQGNPIFTKKNITKAEWIKYFEGDGNIRIDARRRALLETIAEEIGFDRVMVKLFDKSYQEQVKLRQEQLSVDLVENFAVVIGKKLDRMTPDEISFAAKSLFKDIVGTKEEYNRGLVAYGSYDEVTNALRDLTEQPQGWLLDNHPEIFGVFENSILSDKQAKYNVINESGISGLKIEKEKADFKSAIKEKGIDPNDYVIKKQEQLTPEEVSQYNEGISTVINDLWPGLFRATQGQKQRSNTGSFIGTIWGYNNGKLTAKERAKVFGEGITKENVDIKFGQDFIKWQEDIVIKVQKGEALNAIDLISLQEYNSLQKLKQLSKNGTAVLGYRTSELGVLEKYTDISKMDISAEEKIILAGKFRETEEGKEAIRVAKTQIELLKYQTLHIQRKTLENPDLLKKISPLFRFNQGANFFRYLVPIKSITFADGITGDVRLEHDLPKSKFAADIFYEISQGTLTAERFDQLASDWQGTLGPGEAQLAFDAIAGSTFYKDISLKRGFGGKTPLTEKGLLDLQQWKKNLENTFNFIEGRSEWEILINRMAQGVFEQTNAKRKDFPIIEQALKEAFENIGAETFASKDLTKEFDDMLTRRTGLGGEISASKARQLGKGKGKFDLYIPPNAEDFAGLLYKLYGKGKQGDADMALARETLLLPYERGENAISTYRQQISQKFKDFNKKLKAFDMKFDKDAVRSIENAGFTVDQAIRVWIWEKLGYDIPNITLKEQTELSNIVSKNPKLLASAISFKNMFGAGRPYPEPKGDWYASNIKFDAHRYINEGARKMFLEEFITNADAIFTPEFYSKAEAGLGLNWVKNMKEMLNAMKTGQSMPTNLPEYAVIGLNYINGAVGNIMFLNGRSAVLQTISMANFVNWSDNNILAVGKAVANQKNYWKTFMELMNSDFLKQRRDGLEISVEEAEIAKSLRDTKNPLSHLWAKMVQLGYAPTKFADSFAIAAGGAPFYINRTKTYESQGFSNAEAKKMAFDDFRMLAETHQQSSRQDKVSNVQRGLTGRFVYSFSGAPFQMAREQKKAALDFINRRGDDKTNISKFIYYGAMQNLLFTALQQGIFAAAFEDDEVLAGADKRGKRLANSMLDATLRSSGLPGALLAMGKNTIIKYNEENAKGYQGDMGNVIGEAINLSPPAGAKFRNIYKGLQSRKFLLHTKKGRAEVEASNNFIENPLIHANARIIGGITNYPINRLVTKADNLATAYTGLHRGVEADAWQRTFLAAGWDKWSLGFYEKKEDNGPKKTRSQIMIEANAKKTRKEWQEDSIKNARMLLNVKPKEIKKINF